MRIMPPPGPSILQAIFGAPLVTPIAAIPLVALLPGIYVTELDMVMTVPFVFFFSLICGYLGMFVVCLPIMALLGYTKRLDAIRLCFYTTIVGAIAWTSIVGSGHSDFPLLARNFIAGAGCSFAVSAFFCVLGGIPIRQNRARDVNQ